MTNSLWKKIGEPAINISGELGNIHTGSLYVALLTLICDEKINLQNKRIMLFSFGAGFTSSMFIIKAKSNANELATKVNLNYPLANRINIDPFTFTYDTMTSKKEEIFKKVPFTTEVNEYLL